MKTRTRNRVSSSVRHDGTGAALAGWETVAGGAKRTVDRHSDRGGGAPGTIYFSSTSWRCVLRPMTVPSRTLSAANSVVVPLRL
jgi:hypothetical protein